jgi:predicted glycosyltransferase involved in capsule biosynthesis
MTISIIVPLHGFNETREGALGELWKNILAQDIDDYEVLIVEQCSGERAHFFEEGNDYGDPNPNVRHILLADQEKGFNKSWCMNVGAREAKNDRLIFLDVDMMFGKSFFWKIREFALTWDLKFFLCWAYIAFLPGKDEPVIRIVDQSILTAGGAFYIDREYFWNIGGMDENYFGYGGEDNDLWIRVNRTLGDIGVNNVSVMPYALVHRYHDWSEPSPERFYFLNRTLQYPDIAVERLKAASLGNVSGPCVVDFSDLELKEPGIENKEGRGLLYEES